MQSEALLQDKTPDWKNHNNHQRSSSPGAASRWLKAEAVFVVRQQVLRWSQQEKKKNRKQEEELGDWLTFPARAEEGGLGAVVQMAFDVCDGLDEPPCGRPRFHPKGRGHRAERRHLAGSPERGF